MIQIQCTKAQYDRLIDAASTYFENNKCFLGKTFLSCPYIDTINKITCEDCLRMRIKRVIKEKKK